MSWTIERIYGLAGLKGGVCLETEYLGYGNHHRMRCSEGHEWGVSIRNLYKGRWCPACHNLLRKDRSSHLRLNISHAQDLAERRGGDCLSLEYESAQALLQWQCAEGHNWSASYNKVSSGRTWCPVCAGNFRASIEEARLLAREKGGECLSGHYVNAHEPMHWRCGNDHEWWTPFKHVKNSDSWCPDCKWKTEQRVRELVEAKLGIRTPKALPEFMRNPSTGRILELDGFNVEHRIAWEYNGEQHYRPVFGGENIEYRKQLDALKVRLCDENWVTLIVVPCDEERGGVSLEAFIDDKFAHLV